MSRVLLLGVCPLPYENLKAFSGSGIRTWQFAQSLLKDGHEVCLLGYRMPHIYEDKPSEILQPQKKFTYHSLNQVDFENLHKLQQIAKNFKPDCVVGAAVYASWVATQLKLNLPLWADMFGHYMAEAQSKAFVQKSIEPLLESWRFEKDLLDQADVFSCVSRFQEYATIGELGSRGRLNQLTDGYRFAYTIPCGADPAAVKPKANSKPVFRGGDGGINEEHFVILWSGGYNTWTDVNTLFQALETAMAENPQIRFVSTGGSIVGHDTETYPNFLKKIQNSKYADRYLMKGWIWKEEVPRYWAEADLGINIDRYSYEAVLGSRNRILDWMMVDLPIVMTDLGELAEIITQNRIGFTFQAGASKELAELFLKLSENKDLLNETAQQAKKYALEHFTFYKTTEALRQWVNNPQFAPDRKSMKEAFLFRRMDLIAESLKLDFSPADLKKSQRTYASWINPVKSKKNKILQSLRKSLKVDQAEFYSVKFVEHNTPAQVPANDKIPVRVTFKNTSQSIWPSNKISRFPVNISYHWVDEKGKIMRDGERSELPLIIQPGEVCEALAYLYTPKKPGKYTLQWDLVHEDQAWFSVKGCEMLTVSIEVVSEEE